MIKDDYMKERRRVQRLVNRYKKSGYDVEVNIPKLVKNPTEKSIARLKNITPDIVKKNSYAPDLETGEKINFYSYKIRYSKIKPVAAQEILTDGGVYVNDINILYFERIVGNYPDRIQEMVLTKLRGAISVYGNDKVNESLGQMITSGEIVEPSDGYNYRLVSEMMENLAILLRMDKHQQREVNKAFLQELDSQEYYEGELNSW